VCDQSASKEAVAQVAPIAERSHRDLSLEQPTWLGCADAVRPIHFAQTARHAVSAGRTHAEQLSPHFIVEREMAMTFEDRDHLGRNGTRRLLQMPLAARQTTISASCTTAP
jgi:hypothetical protein